MSAFLIAFGGLPGVGKTTLARRLAADLGAVYVRIDTIESAIRSSLAPASMDDAGYRVSYALAEDNLRLGRVVIADCVNPWPLTRAAWAGVAGRTGAKFVEVEIVCSDVNEHRRRVEDRVIPDGPALTWKDVVGRDYHPWTNEHIVVDTAGRTAEECVPILRGALERSLIST